MSAVERPGKIIAVHLNYPSRVAQRGRTPAHPSYFLKPTSSLAASGDAIERPAGTELLAFEGEVALIIGRTVRRVTPEEGWAAVSGVTAANDWGVYDLRTVDKGSNLRNKGGDGFTPLGPAVIPADTIDPSAVRVRTWLNGALVQDDTTADLLFPFGLLVADLSQLITLEPGDVILTGTPAGSSVAVPGDVVEVEVDTPTAPGAPSSGRLVSRVVEGTVDFADYGAAPSVDDLQRVEAWGDAESAGVEPPQPVLTSELRATAERRRGRHHQRGAAQARLPAHLHRRSSPAHARNSHAGRGPHPAVRGSPARPLRGPRWRLQRSEARLRLPEAGRGARDRGARRRNSRHRRRCPGPARPEPGRGRRRHRRRSPRLGSCSRNRPSDLRPGHAPLGAGPPSRPLGGRHHGDLRRGDGPAGRRRDRRRRRGGRHPAPPARRGRPGSRSAGGTGRLGRCASRGGQQGRRPVPAERRSGSPATAQRRAVAHDPDEAHQIRPTPGET